MPDARWNNDDLPNLFASPVVAVSVATSAATSSGSTLPFASLAEVKPGMWVQCHAACAGIGVLGSTAANPQVAAVQGNTITLTQPLMAPVPAGTVIDFVDPNLACDAGPGFCLNDFDYVDESALQVSANSGATKPVITSLGLPGAMPGKSYSAEIPFTGGLPPFTCVVTAGQLPDGLRLDQAGCIVTGALSTPNSRPVSFMVKESAGRSASANFAIEFQNRRTPPPAVP